MLEILLSFGWLKTVTRLIMAGFADRPFLASHVTICHYDGKIYVYGGLNSSIASTSNFDCYDIATDTWTSLTTNGSLRRSAGMVGHNGFIYLYGGSNHAANAYFNTIVRYEIATDTWTTTGLTSGLTRSDFAYHLFGDRFYCFGGWNSSLLSDITYYNIPTNTWVGQGSRAGFRYTGTCDDGTYIYLAGGQTGSILKQFVRYTPATGSFLTLADLPWTSNSAILIPIDGKIFCYSGYTDGQYVAKAAVYDIGANAWTEIDIDNPSIIALTSAIQVGSVAWAVGGYNGSARTGWIRKFTPVLP